MTLKFIGAAHDTDLLERGKIYNVAVDIPLGHQQIVLQCPIHDLIVNQVYQSPAEFARNWAKPGQKVKVRKKKRNVRYILWHVYSKWHAYPG